MNKVQQLQCVPTRNIVRDKSEKIKLIYESFSRLVEGEGYEKVTTRKIAEDAGISVGIIYHYFTEGKPQIAADYWEESLNIMMDPIPILTGSENEVKKEIQIHLDNHKKNEALYRAFDQAILEKKDLFNGLKHSRTELIGTKINVYFSDKSPSQLEDLNKKYMKIYGLVDAIVHRHLFQTPFANSDEELIDTLSDLSLRILAHDH